MRNRYDLVFGTGVACSCTQSLRRAGLQLLSFPLDWVGPNARCTAYDEDLLRRAGHICDDFAHWIELGDFRTRGPNNGDHQENGMLDLYNDRLELQFIHDFPRTLPFEQSFPAVLEKYRRRIARFTGLLQTSRRVLVVHLERPDMPFVTPLADFKTARERLSAKYPGARFDFALLYRTTGIPFAQRKVEHPEPWMTTITFDCKSPDPKAKGHEPDIRALSKALADIAVVRDYRTREEIRRHKAVLLRKRLARSGSDTLLQHRWKKLKKSILKRIPRIFRPGSEKIAQAVPEPPQP